MKIFMCAIAGSGMCSLAGLLKEAGHEVEGADSNFYPPAGDILKNLNIKTYKGFNTDYLSDDIDLFIIGNAIGRGNPVLEYVLDNKLDFMSMPQAIKKFCIKKKDSVVVAGTHGKTTTTAFISYLLSKANMKPGFFIGGKPRDLGNSYSLGKGDFFVSEGDEYETSFFDRSSKFLKYHAKYLLLTSLEHDHFDFFPDDSSYFSAFKNLVNQVPSNGNLIINTDYKLANELLPFVHTKIITYGKKKDADCLIKEIEELETGSKFVLKYKDKELTFQSSLIGEYNVYNFTAGIIFGLNQGISLDIIQKAVLNFKGVERRLGKIKKIGEVDFYEDFAHHPSAVSFLLEGFKNHYKDRKITIFFEPRSWTMRGNFLKEDLKNALVKADEVWLMDPLVSGKLKNNIQVLDTQDIISFLKKSEKKAFLIKDYEEAKERIKQIDLKEKQNFILASNGSFGNLKEFIKNI